ARRCSGSRSTARSFPAIACSATGRPECVCVRRPGCATSAASRTKTSAGPCGRGWPSCRSSWSSCRTASRCCATVARPADARARLDAVRSFEPWLWRIPVEAGLRTSDLRRLARESGLRFAPDPGAAEQSQIGGNIATNAGGPHAYKYGVTGAWVTGLEVVVAPGELVQLGGPLTKDVAGYDLKRLLIGSEGTLGVITAAWLRLTPAPEAAWPVIGFFDGLRAGCGAIERVVGSGLPAAALEYLDDETMRYASATFPGDVPAGGFAVLAEADGSRDEAERIRSELLEVLGEDALGVYAPETAAEIAALWR